MLRTDNRFLCVGVWLVIVGLWYGSSDAGSGSGMVEWM